jgi:hypothetical protein
MRLKSAAVLVIDRVAETAKLEDVLSGLESVGQVNETAWMPIEPEIWLKS